MALKINLYRNNNESSTKYGRVYGRVENPLTLMAWPTT